MLTTPKQFYYSPQIVDKSELAMCNSIRLTDNLCDASIRIEVMTWLLRPALWQVDE